MKTLFNLLFYILLSLNLSFVSIHVTAKIILVEKDLSKNNIELKDPLNLAEERVLPLKKNLNKFIPNIPDLSHCPDYDLGFCIKVDDYPKEHIAKILRKEFKRYELLFNNDELIVDKKRTKRTVDENLAPEKLCPSTKRMIYPRAGLTKDNDWSFIINGGNYTQGVRIEECMNLEGSRTINDDAIECKQKYVYHQLKSVDLEGRVIDESFRLPSMCECILKSGNLIKRHPKIAKTVHSNNNVIQLN